MPVMPTQRMNGSKKFKHVYSKNREVLLVEILIQSRSDEFAFFSEIKQQKNHL